MPSRYPPFIRSLIALSLFGRLFAHDISEGHAHGIPSNLLASSSPPPQAQAFAPFAPDVHLRWDDRFLFVESNGLPSHKMMVGITNWQQQVPLPQDYTGENAWRLPLKPVPAASPISVENRFLRGAIGLAVNGIPIFNPRNNRGEISYKIGELDQWGGHCGRADDYHYHIAPLHLQSVVGAGKPIAYALDGYPILGPEEPDGSKATGIDAQGGHSSPALGYHYHASMDYPYVIAGFHGEVVERDGQVDPQPSAQSVREALQPLRGAVITAFERNGNTSKLSYDVGNEHRRILYSVNANGSVDFEFQNGNAPSTKFAYTKRPSRRPLPLEQRPEPPMPRRNSPVSSATPENPLLKPSSTFVLTSPEVQDGGNLPAEFTGDGAGSTLPLSWTGTPAGTKEFALIMDHAAPDNAIKSYWVAWNIPASKSGIVKNEKDFGKLGFGFRGQIGYEPPHSKGPGPKLYVLTLYALSDFLQPTLSASQTTREVLLEAMKGKVLATASLRVVYTR